MGGRVTVMSKFLKDALEFMLVFVPPFCAGMMFNDWLVRRRFEAHSKLVTKAIAENINHILIVRQEAEEQFKNKQNPARNEKWN